MSISLEVQERTVLKKKVRSLRKDSIVPAVIYGKNFENINIQIDEKSFKEVYKQIGQTKILTLSLGERKINALVKAVFLALNGRDIINIDFYAVQDDVKTKIYVPVKLIGESPLLNKGCLLVKGIDRVYLEALPKDLPHELVVDTSILKDVSQTLLLKDLTCPSGVRFLSSLNTRLASMSQTRAYKSLSTEEKAKEETS